MAKFQIVNPATGSGLTLDSDSPRFAGLCLGLTGGGVTAEATKLVEIACRLLSGWRDSLEVREAQDGRVARVNTRRTAANQMPIQQTQTIHITEQRVVCLREQLRPRLRSATGKAMPQHKRTITDRWIHPKNPSARMFRPYQRRPQEIIVNKDRPPAASRFRVVK